MDLPLKGRKALVTGASRGLGQAMAVGLATAGADVICVSSSKAGTDATTRYILDAGQQAWQYAADFAERKEVQRLAEEVNGEHEVHILVNNAGTIRRTPAIDYSLDDWDQVLKTNLDSMFILSQAFGRRMIERRAGKIINVASLLSFSGGITVPAYTASKHAVAGVTKALANEWAKHNVQVNAIAPGYFSTDNTEALRNDPTRSVEIMSRIPAQRWGAPKDLAGPVVFLASAASDYVTGHVLVVDGGWMAR